MKDSGFVKTCQTNRGDQIQSGHHFKLDTAVKIIDNNKEFFTHSSYVKFYVVTDENSSSPVSALFNTLSLQKQNTLQNAELF